MADTDTGKAVTGTVKAKKTATPRPKLKIGPKTAQVMVEQVPLKAEQEPAPVKKMTAAQLKKAQASAQAVKQASAVKQAETVKQAAADAPAPEVQQAVAEATVQAQQVQAQVQTPTVQAQQVQQTMQAQKASVLATTVGRTPAQIQANKKRIDKEINDLYRLYLSNVTKVSVDEELELEIKFGTFGVKNITRINFDNVMKKFLSSGFTVDSNIYLLRIQNEYMDLKTGAPRLSNIRTEINGLQNIRTYCQSNKLDLIETGISYINKTRFNTDQLTSVDVNDYNFRATLSKETHLDKNVPMVKGILDKWNDRKKIFRYLNRFKLRHPSLPVVIDLSIVKDSKRQGRHYIPEYNIHDSGVFTAPEKYEIEIECINSLVGLGTAFPTPETLNNTALKPMIKYVLAGLQETNYPVGYSEQASILQEYGKLIWGKAFNETRSIDFVGPSSYTLELKNILPVNPDSASPNIRENYTVTDKADGERKLLFIAPTGKIYLINNNLDIQFTGTVAKNADLWNTLLDGEHILYDKKKKFINMYAAFDIYYIGAEDIRSKGFVPQTDEEVATKYRLPVLEKVIEKLIPVSIVNDNAPVPLKITKKRFYLGTAAQSIFQGCSYILKKEHDGLFEYETDGLIFTPANFGVASNKVGEYVEPNKISWEYSFKWKPAYFNTVDFMISLRKNDNGTDQIGSTFNDGRDVTSSSQVAEYKTVILRVGFDETKHGYINPYQDAIDDIMPLRENYVDRKNRYMPRQFYPSDPSDYKAGICNIALTGADKKMYTENDEIIEDNMIVEFRYDATKEEQWRWIPLRVRYDKTAQLRAGEKMFGNAFHVANNIWHTIHYPITPLMLMTGENLPEELSDDDVYYNKVTGVSKTRALRDFHNLYVKSLLIKSVTRPGTTLIDLAVGKGGDWPKWIDAKLKFVFGVDISRDNIQNRLNGAYARYMNYRKRYNIMPAALFVNGNSSVNIKNTAGILVDKDKQITRAVFGQGPKDAKALGQGVYKQYGVAAEGFDVCSIQFAIHYMFETQETLQNFLQNVSEVTKEGGYFIGTSYDGEKLFNMLKNVKENESKVIMSDDGAGGKKKIWELIKRYDRSDFNDDESCVGYAVDVFQESINKTIREYLVNYSYLTRTLENYGFVLASAEDLRNLHSEFNSATGLFSDLFTKMNEDIKKNPRMRVSYEEAAQMSDGERTISFLNRYFIYKKVRKVSDAAKVALNLQHKTASEAIAEMKGSLTAKQAVNQALASASAAPDTTANKSTVKKITKRKLTIGPTQNLSTMVDSMPTVQAAQVQAQQVQAQQVQAPEPVAEPIYAESKPVKKLKRTLNIMK